MNHPTQHPIVESLQQVIEQAIADTDTRTKEIIAFKAIQQVDRDPKLRQQAIAAYQDGQLNDIPQSEDDVTSFLVSAIAEWATDA